MASLDTARQIAGKQKKARERIPGIVDAANAANKRRIKAGLSALGKDLEEANKLAGALVAELGGVVDPPPPPDDGDDDNPPPPVDDGVPNGWQRVEGRNFRGSAVAEQLKSTSGVKNRAYVGCTFQDYTGTIMHGDCGDGVQFINCSFRNLKGSPYSLIFPGSHWETSNDDYGLKWVGCLFENCGDDKDLFEFKCSGSQIVNCRFVNCKGGVRVRHGVGTKIVNCTGLTKVKLRCGPHYVVNCPQADVVAYSGNLPGQNGLWQKLHDHGGGHNMQCAYCAQIAGVKSVQLGYHFGDNDRKYPATECNIAPGVSVNVILERGTTHDPVRL